MAKPPSSKDRAWVICDTIKNYFGIGASGVPIPVLDFAIALRQMELEVLDGSFLTQEQIIKALLPKERSGTDSDLYAGIANYASGACISISSEIVALICSCLTKSGEDKDLDTLVSHHKALNPHHNTGLSDVIQKFADINAELKSSQPDWKKIETNLATLSTHDHYEVRNSLRHWLADKVASHVLRTISEILGPNPSEPALLQMVTLIRHQLSRVNNGWATQDTLNQIDEQITRYTIE